MYQIFMLCIISLMITACKSDTESFFSGRPSEMSMLHGQIIAGSKNEMLILLTVPMKYQDANEKDITKWQGSLISWWNSKKHGIVVEALDILSKNKLYHLKSWLKVRAKYQSDINSKVLTEIEKFIYKEHLNQ